MKIDGSFVRDMLNDSIDLALVKAINVTVHTSPELWLSDAIYKLIRRLLPMRRDTVRCGLNKKAAESACLTERLDAYANALRTMEQGEMISVDQEIAVISVGWDVIMSSREA